MASSVVSSGVQFGSAAAGIKNSGATTILFGTASGALTARLTKGNVWQAATTAFFVSALNHAMHKLEYKSNGEDHPKYKYKDKTYDDKSTLYKDIFLDQVSEQFGITDIIALGAALDHAFPSIDKPFVTPNTSPKTSYASKYGEKLLPNKMPKRLPTHIRNGSVRYTKVLGRFLGRLAGPIGWTLLAYDVSMTLYNTQVIYNKITQINYE